MRTARRGPVRTAGHVLGRRLPAWSAGALALITCTGGLLGAVPALCEGGASAATTGGAAAVKDRITKAYGRSPLAFEPNRGQTAPQVAYLAHGPGYGVFITARRTVLALASHPAAGDRGQVPAPGVRDAGPGRRWRSGRSAATPPRWSRAVTGSPAT